jgi:hypothetical protein
MNFNFLNLLDNPLSKQATPQPLGEMMAAGK